MSKAVGDWCGRAAWSLAVVMVAALLVRPMIVPTIWGDGRHDDTPGFKALMSGQVFRYGSESGIVVSHDETGRQVITLSGTYLLPSGIPPNTIGSEVIYPSIYRVAK